MAWFWQKRKDETAQKAAQSQSESAKKAGLLKRAAKDKGAAKKTAKSDKKTSRERSKKVQTHGIIMGPIITEKAARLAEEGTFVFAVSPRANKIQVADAVEVLYKVHPRRVTLVNIKGKPKVFGARLGQRGAIRKAYVTLQQGEHIDFFESEKSETN